MEIQHLEANITVVMRFGAGMGIKTFESDTEMVEHFIEKCDLQEEYPEEYIVWLNILRGLITSSISMAKRIAKSKARRDTENYDRGIEGNYRAP